MLSQERDIGSLAKTNCSRGSKPSKSWVKCWYSRICWSWHWFDTMNLYQRSVLKTIPVHYMLNECSSKEYKRTLAGFRSDGCEGECSCGRISKYLFRRICSWPGRSAQRPASRLCLWRGGLRRGEYKNFSFVVIINARQTQILNMVLN